MHVCLEQLAEALAKPGVFQHIGEYVALVDEAMPWHSRIKVMCKQFLQFSAACKKSYPPKYFAEDATLGTVGIHIDIVASYLHWLRFKGEAPTTLKTRRVTTVLNYLQETKTGLREQLGLDFIKPLWMSQDPWFGWGGGVGWGRVWVPATMVLN